MKKNYLNLIVKAENCFARKFFSIFKLDPSGVPLSASHPRAGAKKSDIHITKSLISGIISK